MSTAEELIKKINKSLGEESVRLLSTEPEEVEVIPTGIPTLDIALEVGGVPRGRITEIYGHESSGKSTLCQYLVANAQNMGLLCAYIDMEHSLDLAYAKTCGVDVDTLILSQPNSGEDALEIAEALVRSNDVGLVIIDSVAALVPQRELEGDMGDATVGVQARLMSKALRKLSGVVKTTNTAVVFTNQIRQKIGVLYGNPDTTTGGLALKFYSSIRLEIRKSTLLKRKGDVVGNLVKVKVAKNKLGAPFKTTEFNMIYGVGVDKTADLITACVAFGILEQKGSYYYFNGENVGQGKKGLLSWLETQNRDELLEQIWYNKKHHIIPVAPKEED